MKDAGNLSIDFLVGFTIFLLAFVWVATMIPGLLLGLKANGIDYDAVAYRTGVILVEDQGWPKSPAWESFPDEKKSDVSRFGLAVSSESPNILSEEKVTRFFCVSTTDPDQGFVYPDDYHSRAIFGDQAYRFNISLNDVSNNKTYTVGDLLPDNFGYIRRVVKIKGFSNTTIGAAQIASHHFNNTDDVQVHEFTIMLNCTNLSTYVKDPAYQIDPAREQIIINITDMQSAMDVPTATIQLTDFKINKLDNSGYSNEPILPSFYPYVDGNSSRIDHLNYPVTSNISIMVPPALIDSMKAGYAKLYFNLTFTVTPASTFINNTNNPYASAFDYNYDPSQVTQPKLRDAVVEVAVW